MKSALLVFTESLCGFVCLYSGVKCMHAWAHMGIHVCLCDVHLNVPTCLQYCTVCVG